MYHTYKNLLLRVGHIHIVKQKYLLTRRTQNQKRLLLSIRSPLNPFRSQYLPISIHLTSSRYGCFGFPRLLIPNLLAVSQ